MYSSELLNRLISAASLADRDRFVTTAVALANLAAGLMARSDSLGDLGTQLAQQKIPRTKNRPS